MQFYENAILIDTSAALAIHNPRDKFHKDAKFFFESTVDVLWVVLNCTKHETYTRARYDFDFIKAIMLYDFLSVKSLYQICFNSSDECKARKLLERYKDHKISFHDALCATVMKNYGIYKAFTFDGHFNIFGFEVCPGQYGKW